MQKLEHLTSTDPTATYPAAERDALEASPAAPRSRASWVIEQSRAALRTSVTLLTVALLASATGCCKGNEQSKQLGATQKTAAATQKTDEERINELAEKLGAQADAEGLNLKPESEGDRMFRGLLSQADFISAVAFAKKDMRDTTNEVDEGSEQLRAWAMLNGGILWAELQALPQTTIAHAKKDIDVVRGSRLCTAGTIVEIRAKRENFGVSWMGNLLTDDGNVVSFVAVGNTDNLVEQSRAKFCGALTGLHSYSNAGGGTTHAVRVVGVFDLPSIRNAKLPAASETEVISYIGCCEAIKQARARYTGNAYRVQSALVLADYETRKDRPASKREIMQGLGFIKNTMQGLQLPEACP